MSVKSWLISKLKKALREDKDHMATVEWGDGLTTLNSVADSHRIRSSGMNFTLYNADGGWVLEYHTYETKTDSAENRIHIIHDTDNFGDKLSKILTLELLRR